MSIASCGAKTRRPSGAGADGLRLAPTRHPLPCRPDYWRRVLHCITAAFYRASPDALGVVRRGETRQPEFYPYEFATKPNFAPPTMANPHPDAGAPREPDARVFDQIYRHELLWRLPKAGA